MGSKHGGGRMLNTWNFVYINLKKMLETDGNGQLQAMNDYWCKKYIPIGSMSVKIDGQKL